MNSLNMSINVISSPVEAFNALKEKPHFWLPLIIIPLAFAAYQLVYFNFVDYGWLLEQMALQAQEKGGNPDQVEAMKNIPKMLMMIPGIIMGTVFIIFVQTIYATYLMLVSKGTGDNFSFKAMFSLTLWCGLPAVFTMLACIINMLITDSGRVFFDAVNPFSLNSLIFDVGLASPFRGIVTQIDLFMLWSWVLITIAYKQFSKRSYGHAALVALAPYVLVYGIWILVAAM